jgi:hypothetical protein
VFHGPAICLARGIALTVMMPAMKNLRTLLVELKQLPAEIGYILGWIGDILAVLIVIASTILYVALSNEPLFALGGCIVALVVFLTGRGLHYILTARS